MRPKGKLFALLAIFAAIGLVTATGAFTSVSAQRTVSVDIAGDSAALVGIQSTSQYAYENNGQFLIDFSGNNPNFPGGAEGVNPNATTRVDYLFNVTNNGDTTIDIDFIENSQYISLYNSSTPSNGANVTGISSGSTIAVGIEVDTTNLNEGQGFNTTLTIEANSQ